MLAGFNAQESYKEACKYHASLTVTPHYIQKVIIIAASTLLIQTYTSTTRWCCFELCHPTAKPQPVPKVTILQRSNLHQYTA